MVVSHHGDRTVDSGKELGTGGVCPCIIFVIVYLPEGHHTPSEDIIIDKFTKG